MSKAKETKAKVKLEDDTELFSKIGINVENEKLSIDFAKTKEFFDSLKKKMELVSKNIEKNFQEGADEFKENLGIRVDEERIEIDFGEAKSFISDVGAKIEELLASLEHSVDQLNKKS
ncbi:MAG: hypothetical protein JXQ68_05675 [Campylobacterales bacterium]|nr:hypothetical protein [Campylobacterales bacterium]